MYHTRERFNKIVGKSTSVQTQWWLTKLNCFRGEQIVNFICMIYSLTNRKCFFLFNTSYYRKLFMN